MKRIPWRTRLQRKAEKAAEQLIDRAIDGVHLLTNVGNFVPPLVAKVEKTAVRYHIVGSDPARDYGELIIAFAQPILGNLGKAAATAILFPIVIMTMIDEE